MKIWQVEESDTEVRFYWYETLKEARYRRDTFLASRPMHRPDLPEYTCKITRLAFGGSPRRALVEAMNYAALKLGR